MSDCESQYQRICRDEFGELHAKLDKLDEAIRGNGKVGIQRRLDRLENAEGVRSRLLWLIAGTTATLAVSALWRIVIGA